MKLACVDPVSQAIEKLISLEAVTAQPLSDDDSSYVNFKCCLRSFEICKIIQKTAINSTQIQAPQRQTSAYKLLPVGGAKKATT